MSYLNRKKTFSQERSVLDIVFNVENYFEKKTRSPLENDTHLTISFEIKNQKVQNRISKNGLREYKRNTVSFK